MSAIPPFIGQTFEPKPKKKEEPPKIPYACIRKAILETHCKRTPGIKEFLFTDARIAIAHYSSSQYLRVCTECAQNASADLEKEDKATGVRIP